MSADIYADNVANIRDQISKLQADRIENYDSLAQGITDKYNTMLEGYTEKWRTVSEAGGEDLAGMLGAKGIYKGGKKLAEIYQKRQARKKAQQEQQQEQQKKDVGEDDEFDDDPQEIPDQGGRKMFQDEGDVDENQDWYNDAGEKYFTGTEADHQEYYNDDGTLKDPSNVPEGHQANSKEPDGDDETPSNDQQNTGLDDEDDDELDVNDAQPTQNPAMNDATGTESNDAQFNFGEDEFADDPTFLQPNIQPNSTIFQQPSVAGSQESTAGRTFAQQRPTDEQLDADPFQPTANQPIRSEFTRTTQNEAPTSGGDPPPINDANSLVGGEQDAVRAGINDASSEGSSLLENISQAGRNVFNNLAQRGQNIRQGFQNVKNFFSKSAGDTAETAADTTAEAVSGGVEGGSELAGLGIGDAVLGAIPVVGEIGLAVGGLVAIGEGIYHLFHHPKAPPAPPAPPPIQAPQTMTQKYSMALPSADASVDRAGSVSAF